ncbi:MAG: Fur family transcriptional regulator [Pseudomonadota bacterium]
MPISTSFPGGHDHRRCAREALARAEAVCRDKELRFTALRRRVLELVWEGHEPVKAYDLLDRLQRGSSTAAPPTVYRALEFLLDAGLVHRVESLNAYVGCADPAHAHQGQFFVCENCHAMAEVLAPEVSRQLDRQARELGFRVRHRVVEVTGLCRHCQQRQGATPAQRESPE